MSYLQAAGPFGTYGPFHCLTENPPISASSSAASSRANSPLPSAQGSLSVTTPPRSSSPCSFRSIQTINKILSARRRRHHAQRTISATSILPPTFGPNDFLRMNEGIYNVTSQPRKTERTPASVGANRNLNGPLETLALPPQQLIGLMEPRPQEVVGWGIGEVLHGDIACM